MLYNFRICKSGTFHAEPRKKLKLDLLQISKKMKAIEISNKKFEIKVKTKAILVLESEGVKIMIYPSGKILISGCDEGESENIAFEIIKKIEEEI